MRIDDMDDGRQFAPAAGRNIAPILAVLRHHAPASGRALEIASGTGQHMARLTDSFPGLDWQPTDLNPDRMASIAAWRVHTGRPNFGKPQVMDASQPWPDTFTGFALICLVNVLHLIAEPPARAILEYAAAALASGGVFTIYGPFLRGAEFASDGDRVFHDTLQAQDPATGYKDIGWVEDVLRGAGMEIAERVEMPAANLMVVARRT
ncbi:MAG: DUF938 domain-containing protein [Brevirhabdus sp.]